MNIAITKMIMAAVTLNDRLVSGVPVFHAKNKEEQERMAVILSRVLEAVAHDMGNGTMIIVKH